MMDNDLLFEKELLTKNNNLKACSERKSGSVIYISENKNGVSYIKDSESGSSTFLKIVNQKPSMRFLSFDNCYADGLKDYSGKRCDCLLFTEKDILFAELKFNIHSRRRITANLSEGREQLSSTIWYFYNNFNKRFISFQRYAIIAIPKPFYPKSQARLLKVKKEFYDSNHHVEYFEEVEFTFFK